MSSQHAVEVRPDRVEEWLAGLPYADFPRSVEMLEQAAEATNRQALKPAARLQLLKLYTHTYQYLLQTQVKGGPPPGLDAIDTKLRQVGAIKRLAMNLAFGCRLVLDPSAQEQGGLLSGRATPAETMVLALRLLGQVMILGFHEYAPVPKTLWREMAQIYLRAESAGLHREAAADPERDPPARISVLDAYQQILATSLVDPHHLPFGAVWEVYEQVGVWLPAIRLGPYTPVQNPAGYFVVDLSGGHAPVSYARFREEAPGERLRQLDLTELQLRVKEAQDRLFQSHGLGDEPMVLSPQQARLLLGHMARAWGLPPRRYLPRRQQTGEVEICLGFNAAYFRINGDRDFDGGQNPEAASGVVGGEPWPSDPNRLQARYAAEPWNVVNAGPGGMAVYKSPRPRQPVRIGELLALRAAAPACEPGWMLGVVRWLTIQRTGEHRIGIQIVARLAQAVALRAITGGPGDTGYRRAFLMGDGAGREPLLLTTKGLYVRGRSLELHDGSAMRRLQAGELHDTTAVYEQFSFSPRE